MKTNIRPLKEKALSWPEPVKSLILSESDELDSFDLISKLGVWEKLLRMPQKGGTRNEQG